MFNKMFRYCIAFNFLICLLINNNIHAVSGFIGTTEIALGGGKYKQIKDIKEGDKIRSYNFATKETCYNTVKKVTKNIEKSFFGEIFGNKYININYYNSDGALAGICAGLDTRFICFKHKDELKEPYVVSAENLNEESHAFCSKKATLLSAVSKDDITDLGEYSIFYRLNLSDEPFYFVTRDQIMVTT